MKIMREFILTVLLSSFIAVPIVYAQHKPVMRGAVEHERMEKKIQEIYNRLNLSEDQKTQLEANKQKQNGQMKSFFAQMKTQRNAMHQELMKPDLDMNKVDSIQLQLKTLHSQMMDNRLNSILEVRRILTPDQFNKFISLMEKHRLKRHGPDGRGANGDRPSKDEEHE